MLIFLIVVVISKVYKVNDLREIGERSGRKGDYVQNVDGLRKLYLRPGKVKTAEPWARGNYRGEMLRYQEA